jgi:hypothetical protein
MSEDGVIKKNIKLNRRDISYTKFILEGYEGLATITTIDSHEAIVQLSIMPDFVSDIDEIFGALKEEIDFCEIDGEEKP